MVLFGAPRPRDPPPGGGPDPPRPGGGPKMAIFPKIPKKPGFSGFFSTFQSESTGKDPITVSAIFQLKLINELFFAHFGCFPQFESKRTCTFFSSRRFPVGSDLKRAKRCVTRFLAILGPFWGLFGAPRGGHFSAIFGLFLGSPLKIRFFAFIAKTDIKKTEFSSFLIIFSLL